MKKMILLILFCALSFSETSTANLRNVEYHTGIVVHVFEDFVSSSVTHHRIAKIRLADQADTKELTVIDIPTGITLHQGDRVLVSIAEQADSFGMGEDITSSFVFVDFARQGLLWILGTVLVVALLLINRVSWGPATLTLSSIFTILFVLPFWLELRLPPWLFLVLSLVGTSYLLPKALPSQKLVHAVLAALTGTLITALAYQWFADSTHVTEQLFLNKFFPGTAREEYVAVDGLAIGLASYFLSVFSALFLIRVSYKHTIYNNLRVAIYRLTYVFFMLLVGLGLPTYIFFIYNGYGSFYLFNFFPFAMILSRLLFIFFGVLLSCLCYLFFYYINHRHYFQKNIHVPGETKVQAVDLNRLLPVEKAEHFNIRRTKRSRR